MMSNLPLSSLVPPALRRGWGWWTAALTALLLLWGAVDVPQAASPDWQSKVDPWVLSAGRASSQVEFLVVLTEQADLSGAAALGSKAEKGWFVYTALTETARRTQGPVLAAIQSAGAAYRPYWVANLVWVRGDLALVEALALRPDVARLSANPAVTASLPEPLIGSPADPAALSPGRTPLWNIAKIRAPELWSLGITGQGVVIGGQDTGYTWDHPALKNAYQGWDGSAANHNYHWHDAIHVGEWGGTNVCGYDSPVPCDDWPSAHGTHTMGTMVGDDGAGMQIGAAPGARWIGCRNMAAGVGKPSTYLECYQFFLAPTDLSGQNPDPSKAPDIINNSWGCPPSEGCTDPNVLLSVVNAVQAAGILNVSSAGNNGPNCSTVVDPAGIYAPTLSVGSVNASDSISGFSSRGPVTVDGSGRRKPDMVAPGESILSSVKVGYSYSSGTSMAAPHVAGAAALLLSAFPEHSGHPDTLRTALAASAVPLYTTQGCGGDTALTLPNNVYGAGRMDVFAAYQSLLPQLHLAKSVQSFQGLVNQVVITYTLTVTNQHNTPATGLVLTDTLPAGTAFFSASPGHTLQSGVVRWEHPSLAAGAAWQVYLAVTTTPGLQVTNLNYAVASDQAAPITAPPVTIQIYRVLLPWMPH